MIATDYLFIEASHCKTAESTGMPVCKVSFSKHKEIFDFIREFVIQRKAEGHRLLFTTPTGGALAPWFNGKLRDLFHTVGISTAGNSSHCFRRGTASVLSRCLVPLRAINRHLGWAPTSKMVEVYERSITVQPIDRSFFHDVISS